MSFCREKPNAARLINVHKNPHLHDGGSNECNSKNALAAIRPVVACIRSAFNSVAENAITRVVRRRDRPASSVTDWTDVRRVSTLKSQIAEVRRSIVPQL
jgi:hypothetical protein